MSYEISDIATAGMRKLSQLDYMANNLANVATPGFKAELLYFSPETTSSTEHISTYNPSVIVDYAQGAMQKTDNSLDVAIEGNGFFAIKTRDEVAYTRQGNFTINKNNELVTKSGDYVLGETGKITIKGDTINIDQRGFIKVDGNQVDKLKIVNFDNLKTLIKKGEGFFVDPGGAGLKKMENPELRAGYLEASNVKVIGEMIEMIDGQRCFEGYQKVIQTSADLDKLSTNRVGRLV